ncbi:MAG: hypothetical protein J7K88_07245 [Candidatus Fermentibacteraceae bacterium]|nr:hypothetical protein [Candidatus Fermentibacteraceae bacterium]
MKDCKQFVDSLVADMEFSDPEKYTYLSASEKGCNVRALLILAVVSLVIVLLTTELGSVVLSFFQQL